MSVSSLQQLLEELLAKGGKEGGDKLPWLRSQEKGFEKRSWQQKCWSVRCCKQNCPLDAGRPLASGLGVAVLANGSVSSKAHQRATGERERAGRIQPITPPSWRELAAGLWSEAGWTKAVLGATNSWVLTSLPLFNDCISAITAFVAAIAASAPLLLLLFSSHSSLKVAQSLCG